MNSHGYFILGMMILILWGFSDGVSLFLRRKEKQDLPYDYFSGLWKILFLSLGVLFLNPQGVAGVWSPIKTALNMPVGSQKFMNVIHELLGPFQEGNTKIPEVVFPRLDQTLESKMGLLKI